MVQLPERPTGGDAQALKVTLDRLVRNVGTLLGVPTVSVALLDADTGDLVTWAALGAGPDGPRHTRFRPNEGIAGWVAAHLEPVIVHDAAFDSRFKPLGGAQIRSLLCVPLIDVDQLLGTLTATSPEPGAFDTRRQQLLQIFADQAVLAISKTRQAEAAKTQARELSALLDASHALTSSLEPGQVFAYIVASVRKVIGCDDAVIYAYDEHAEVLRVVTGLGTRIEPLGGAVVPLHDARSIAAWVAKNRRARISSPHAGEVGTITEMFLAGDEMSLLCVPLVSKDRLRGVIMLARRQPFQPGELGAMLNLSNIVAATLENAQLYQAARAEREQQAAIFAAASDAIALVDASLVILEANDAFSGLMSKPREQVLGRDCCELLSMHDGLDCLLCGSTCLVRRAVKSGEAISHIECELPNHERPLTPGRSSRPRGLSARYVDFSITPVMSLDGRRALLVGRDITALREMDLMKANFLSMVSHELRAPLQTINGYLDLTLSGMGGDLNEQHREFVRRARAGGEHLAALVDDLLLISRRDAGQFNLNLQEIDLAPVITEMMEEMELNAEDVDVSLVKQVADELPLVLADGPRIAQVIRNLVTNAVKFTRAGGSVTVSADVTPEQLVIRVQDTGVGIAPEHLERIFERFYQVTTSVPDGRAHGQGLGLAIVRIIVEGHGGQVQVSSTLHEGSTFTVRLPRLGLSLHSGQETLPA
jgi:signal transduction histidine kinase/GAF domain-containing protein